MQFRDIVAFCAISNRELDAEIDTKSDEQDSERRKLANMV